MRHQVKESKINFIKLLLLDMRIVLLHAQIIFWKTTDQECSYFLSLIKKKKVLLLFQHARTIINCSTQFEFVHA